MCSVLAYIVSGIQHGYVYTADCRCVHVGLPVYNNGCGTCIYTADCKEAHRLYQYAQSVGDLGSADGTGGGHGFTEDRECASPTDSRHAYMYR